MGLIEILFVGVSLAMDAFAVALCKGLASKKFSYKKAIVIALYFGVFQAFMPLIGFLLSENLSEHIINVGHLIVFFLLSLIGISMILESKKTNYDKIDDNVDIKTMFILALSTSIDAFGVGIGFAILRINIYITVIIIGVLTFILSLFAVKIGYLFGNKYEKNSILLGGIILLILAFKVLIEHF